MTQQRQVVPDHHSQGEKEKKNHVLYFKNDS